jgi:16S rRNA (uracil1498-N3)-methyltransferase
MEIGLMDGHGALGVATVLPGRLLRIDSVETALAPKRRTHLYIAPPRRQRMDQILRQSAELGVWSIQPMICERSVSTPDEDSVAGRWEDVLMEACKQSGNPFLPEAKAPLAFGKAADEALSRGFKCHFGAVGGASAGAPGPDAEGDYAWFVGPEGGFSPAEEDFLRSKGFKPLRVGRCVLRVETAAVCGLALLS